MIFSFAAGSRRFFPGPCFWSPYGQPRLDDKTKITIGQLRVKASFIAKKTASFYDFITFAFIKETLPIIMQ